MVLAIQILPFHPGWNLHYWLAGCDKLLGSCRWTWSDQPRLEHGMLPIRMLFTESKLLTSAKPDPVGAQEENARERGLRGG